MFVISLLLWAMAVSPVLAQQSETFDVGVTAEVRDLLAQAESLLADNRAGQAYGLLSPLETELAGNPYYDYLLGIAALDSGHVSEAVFSLRRSVAEAPQFSGARMELGRAYFDSGNPALARSLFVALLDEGPPPEARNAINLYIDAIDARPGTPDSSLRGYLELFAGSDSNANGSTANDQFLGFTLNPENLETDSPFAEVAAGFSWIVPRSTSFAWVVNMRAGHRDNSDASFVNSTIVNGSFGTTWQRGDFFGRAGFDAFRVARDGDENEIYAGVDLLAGRRLNESWDVSLGLRAGRDTFDSSIEVLDVDRYLYTVGVAYRFASLGRLSLEAIGGNDNERQSGSPYGNSKAGARLSLSAPIGNSAFLHGSLGTLTSDYDGMFFGASREDDQTTASLQIEFRDVLTDGLTIAPRFRYIDNESDVPLYEYDRTEIGLLIRWASR